MSPSTPAIRPRDVERAMAEPFPEILLVGPVGQQVLITGGDPVVAAALDVNGQAWTVLATPLELRQAMRKAMVEAGPRAAWPTLYRITARILNHQKGLPS